MTVADARAALLAVRDVSDKPVLVSFTCDENGRTITGTDICAALVIMQSMGIDAFGMNCSTGPKEMLPQFERLREFAMVPLAVKPNAGLPKIIDGKTVYECTPEELAGYTEAFNKAGAAMFGGCCGTGPDHIDAIKKSLSDFTLLRPDPAHQDKIVCATEKEVFILEPGMTTDTILSCGPELEDDIKAQNRKSGSVISVEITSAADLDEFAAAQYAIRKPLCIVCEDIKLLDQALALYQGRAMYAGTLTTEQLLPLVKKYGLII
jgi:5-methyltetrahydrofolate--homocysteine methyltransferase